MLKMQSDSMRERQRRKGKKKEKRLMPDHRPLQKKSKRELNPRCNTGWLDAPLTP